MTNFQHSQEPSISASTLKSVLHGESSGTQHASDPLGVLAHTVMEGLLMEEKTHVVDTNHQVTHVMDSVK
jgi:hypothetical protein